MTKKDVQLEKAFERLEEILELVQEEAVSLDKSLKLYEEANELIEICGKQLGKAEKKIESLMKKRDGSLVMDEFGNPTTEEFNDVSE